MNEIVSKFLLVGDKFIPEMHIEQPGFTYAVCGPFTKNKERIEIYADRKFMPTIFTKMSLIKLVFTMANDLWQIKRFSKKSSIVQTFER